MLNFYKLYNNNKNFSKGRKMQLREEQSKFIEQAFNRLQNYDYSIYEMPTAFGKTYSSLMLAKKLIEEKEASRVFIVTSNNALARRYLLRGLKR